MQALVDGLGASDLGLSAIVAAGVLAIFTGRLLPARTVSKLLDEKERLIHHLEQAHRDDQATIALLLDSAELTTRVVASLQDRGVAE